MDACCLSVFVLPLRELEPLARTLLAVFLSFFGARVAGKEIALSQAGTQLGVKQDQRARDTQPDSSRLAVDPSTPGIYHNIKFAVVLRKNQRLANLGAQCLRGEILLKRTPIHLNLSRAGGKSHPRHGSFPSSGTPKLTQFSHTFSSCIAMDVLIVTKPPGGPAQDPVPDADALDQHRP